MKEFSLKIFANQELIPLIFACLAAGLFLFLIFMVLPKNKKTELFGISLVTICYAILSFWNLGTTNFPQTWWQAQVDNETILFEVLGDTTQFDGIYLIGGEGDNNALESGYQVWFNDLEVYGSNDKNVWTPLATVNNQSNYLGWIVTEGEWDYRYISIKSPSFRTVIHEFGLKQSGTDNFLPLQLVSYSNPQNTYSPQLIIDEQETIPAFPSAYNSSYFDEIYHARNAWEIASGQDMYSSVHPLLGTTLMSFGIRLFGMNPFGWRVMGALFSVMILPLFYLLAKRLFKNWKVSLFSTALLACDFMLITTARIGTLEPFSIFFILLMTYFMVIYLQTPTNNLKQQLFSLALCGLSMGLAISTKWTGAYAAVGLAILFFTHFFKHFFTSVKDNSSPFKKNWLIILLWCCLFFILIPFLIYCFSFFFTKVWKNDAWSIANVISHSVGMYNYHSTLTATHPFQSVWYQWLFDIQPIWYYFEQGRDQILYSISCFNNPLISWVGVFSIGYVIWHTAKTKSQTGFIILISYFAALIPWVLIDRCIFSYHYYPAIPFLILAISYMFSIEVQKRPKIKTIALLYLVAVISVFIIFLPALTGWGSTSPYLDFLTWLPSWYFGR
ncbi:MAG: phospholipid carrier-dependent glycosyltransferase [Anaerorhabdus sp.]